MESFECLRRLVRATASERTTVATRAADLEHFELEIDELLEELIERAVRRDPWVLGGALEVDAEGGDEVREGRVPSERGAELAEAMPVADVDGAIEIALGEGEEGRRDWLRRRGREGEDGREDARWQITQLDHSGRSGPLGLDMCAERQLRDTEEDWRASDLGRRVPFRHC